MTLSGFDDASELRKGTYDVRQYSPSQENHMSPPWRIFYPDLKFLGYVSESSLRT